MTSDVLAQIVIGAVEHVLELPSGSVMLSSRLSDELGADSIAMLQIADLAEELCLAVDGTKVTFGDGDLSAITSVQHAVDYLTTQVNP